MDKIDKLRHINIDAQGIMTLKEDARAAIASEISQQFQHLLISERLDILSQWQSGKVINVGFVKKSFGQSKIMLPTIHRNILRNFHSFVGNVVLDF